LIRRPGRQEEEHRECIQGFEAINSRKGYGGSWKWKQRVWNWWKLEIASVLM
jgi:hypothetical protein